MILIVDMNWKKGSLGYYEFVESLIAVIGNKEKVIVKHYKEIEIDDIADIGKIILSGNALQDFEFLKEPDKFEWIKYVDIPILGICAGMQAIGVAFNLPLKCNLEIGMIQIGSILDNALFSSNFKAYALHNYAVEPSTDFEVLARSAQCVQAIKHKQKSIYGVLFHPEVRNQDILERFMML